MELEVQNHRELTRETRARVLCYADADNWQVVKKTVSWGAQFKHM
jgi:hypothetical protein